MASLLANSLATLVARLLVPVFSFVISVTIARLYGAETLGVYVQVMALAVIFQTVAAAGIQLMLTRDLAAEPQQIQRHLERAGSFAFASGAVATAAYLVYAWAALDGDPRWAAVALAVTMVPSARLAIQEGFFMATRSHHRMTVVALAENVLKLVLAATAFLFGSGIVAVCAAIGAARLAAVRVGGRLMASAGCSVGWRVSVSEAVAFARQVAPFAVLLIVSMVYFRVDVLLVGRLASPTDAGLYGAAITLYTVFLLVLGSVMSAVYPRLSSTFHGSREGFAEASLLSMKLLALGMVPLAVPMILFAEWGPTFIFGAEYAGAAPVLRLLAASLPLHAVNGALGQALQAGRHQDAMVRIVTVGLASHVIGIWLLVPRMGIEGAAVSVLISSTIVTAGTMIAFHRRVARFHASRRGAVAVASVVLPIVATLAAPPPWVVPVSVAVLAVFAIASIAGAVTRPEIDRLAGAVLGPRAAER